MLPLKGEEIQRLLILDLGLDRVCCQLHAPVALYPPGKDPGTHCAAGWVGLRAGLNTEARGKILCLCGRSNPGRPVCNQTKNIVLSYLIKTHVY
jgi:hypothetical protein